MIIDDVGIQPYLGIHIDYDKEEVLNTFTKETLKDRYLWKGETHAQQAFARSSIFGATYKGHTDFNLGQKLYKYASNNWFSFSTPILSNGGTSRGLPISCFLNYVPDSRDGLSAHYDENIWLASGGGGIGGFWGNIRSNGVDTSNGSRSTGSIPFMHVVDSQMLAFNQGITRRGSYAAYLNISHPEIEEFIGMRKTTGGDLNRKCLNLHNAVNITNGFLEAVANDDDWRLIDPKTNTAVKIVSARDLWFQLIHTRMETGEPYIVNIDNCNAALPEEQKKLGLEIKQSNLCSEIILPTNEERTAVCCLSSVNLEYFDEWSTVDEFIPDLITMLDNVLEHFIDSVKDTGGYSKAAYSAMRERSVGLGAMGFHSYLQKNSIPFESMYASSFNHKAFTLIKDRALTATRKLGEERGEAPDMKGSGKRNAHLLAIAPNASSSIICGGASPSVEPFRANVYTHKTLTGSFRVRNKYLSDILLKLIPGAKKREEVWKDIEAHNGSVQHLDILDDDIKEIFKTAPEINQIWIIEHAKMRQEHICQSQSINLFFKPPAIESEQEIHNDFLQYVHDVHWAGAHQLKSLYYLRSDSARETENVNIKIPRINLEEIGCLSCEG
jgi:ribonucleoside-diphosphate reductase alpha chain